MKAEENGIHIIGVEVENFHRLRAAHIEIRPDAGLVRVTGKNKAGKTSLIRSIAAALGGAGEVLPASVNTESEDGTGKIVLRLDNGFSVERRFTESNPKGYLTVIGPDGGKHSQQKLGEWLGTRSFDPLALFDLKPAQLADVFFSLGTDPGLGAKLQENRREQARVQEERRPLNSQKQRAERYPKPEGERPEPVDVTASMERLKELRGVQNERDALDSRIQVCDHAVAVSRDALTGQEKLIADLRLRLADEEANLPRFEHDLDKAMEAATEAEKAFLAVPDPAWDIAAVEARISEADAVNRALEPWKTYDRAQEDAKEAAGKAAELTSELGALRVQESKLLADAGIPVPGLSFDEDGTPLLNGLPLEVASGAERIQMAVSVAVAANPDLRVCLVDEANDMDLDMLAALDGEAKRHGFQVWVCRIGLEGAGEIVVEDGEARANGAEVDAEPEVQEEAVA